MQNQFAIPLLIAVIAYLAGSINFPILLFKILGKEDPRKGFSGNPGTTNVYRQAGIFWATVVLLMDLGRSVAVAWAAINFLDETYVTWIGLFLILGNRYPCFHRFKGGKGVANFLGFSAVITFWAALLSGITWVVVNLVTKKPFIASFAMVAVLTIGTSLIFKGNNSAIVGTVITASLIIISHKKNIIEAFTKSKQRAGT